MVYSSKEILIASRAVVLNELENQKGFFVSNPLGEEDLEELWSCVLEDSQNAFASAKILGKKP